MIEVNCLGLLYCTHAALPLMREQGSGHIVNVASVAGRRASLGSGVYNMTKWGVVGFSEALRQEALHANIRVTVVEPGFVETELLETNEGYVQDAAAKLKDEMGEVLRAEDIADAIVHALGRAAAREHQRGARAADVAAHLGGDPARGLPRGASSRNPRIQRARSRVTDRPFSCARGTCGTGGPDVDPWEEECDAGWFQSSSGCCSGPRPRPPRRPRVSASTCCPTAPT